MTPRSALKQTQLIIFGAFAALPAMLLVFVAPSLKMPMTPVTPVVAGAAALGCLFVIVSRMSYTFEVPQPSLFQNDLLIALASAELVFLVGLFMGSAPIGALPFAVTDWLLMFGGILPRTLSYWRRWEQSNS
jgi:hypothetical protein